MKQYQDTYRHKGLRRQLVLTLKQKGITDQKVLDAINAVPRHIFFDDAFIQHAYQDKAFPIGEGQTISQPYTVAFQTMMLDVKPGQRILEIGTGSGYQACVLIALGADLYTIERIKPLYEKASHMLTELGFDARFFCGDGTQGLEKHAPYDRIIVTAGAPAVPEKLIRQLADGGIIIIPVGESSSQRMIRITKNGDEVIKEELGNFSFVPLKGKDGW